MLERPEGITNKRMEWDTPNQNMDYQWMTYLLKYGCLRNTDVTWAFQKYFLLFFFFPKTLPAWVLIWRMLVLSAFTFNSCFVVWKKKMMFMDLSFEEEKKVLQKMFNFAYCWDNIFKTSLTVCLFHYIVIDVHTSSC